MLIVMDDLVNIYFFTSKMVLKKISLKIEAGGGVSGQSGAAYFKTGL